MPYMGRDGELKERCSECGKVISYPDTMCAKTRDGYPWCPETEQKPGR